MKNITKFFILVVIGIAIFNVTMTNIDLSYNDFSLLSLKFNVASADGESGTETLKRIKTTCNCMDDVTGQWSATRITACEEYEWHIPMVRTTCKTNNCPPGSSC